MHDCVLKKKCAYLTVVCLLWAPVGTESKGTNGSLVYSIVILLYVTDQTKIVTKIVLGQFFNTTTIDEVWRMFVCSSTVKAKRSVKRNKECEMRLCSWSDSNVWQGLYGKSALPAPCANSPVAHFIKLVAGWVLSLMPERPSIFHGAKQPVPVSFCPLRPPPHIKALVRRVPTFPPPPLSQFDWTAACSSASLRSLSEELAHDPL